MTLAFPFFFTTFSAISVLKNSGHVSIPFLFAISAMLVAGSIPKTDMPCSLNPNSKTPTLLPTSITSELGLSPNLLHIYRLISRKCSLPERVVEDS